MDNPAEEKAEWAVNINKIAVVISPFILYALLMLGAPDFVAEIFLSFTDVSESALLDKLMSQKDQLLKYLAAPEEFGGKGFGDLQANLYFYGIPFAIASLIATLEYKFISFLHNKNKNN